MKGQVEEAKFNAKLAEQHSNQNEQYSRPWNLKILFIPEKSGNAQETLEESEKEALRVFHDLLGLRHITPDTWMQFTGLARRGKAEPDPSLSTLFLERADWRFFASDRSSRDPTPKWLSSRT